MGDREGTACYACPSLIEIGAQPMRAYVQPRALAALSILAFAFAACGPGAATSAPTGVAATPGATTGAAATAAGDTGTVKVTLQEFAVLPAEGSVKAGDVTFQVTNKGPDDKHEFVVIKSDLAPDKLPTKATGEVDEDGTGIEVIDEVEEMAVGDTDDLKVNLKAGAYVLICNIFEADENVSHYKNGMRIAFTVN
jgi:uncharacterized cupredoxin-like copper-binding protein